MAYILQKSDIYAPIPPISPICELLAPSPGSKALFDIHGNMGENGYFYRLHSCVQLLDTVLIGIDDYVQLENSKVRLEPEEQECNLNLINAGLDTLHGKIGTPNPKSCNGF